MKLKQSPDDFQVEELTAVAPGDGPFALYLLRKRGWTTPDAIKAVRQRWRIQPGRISFGGLKDRHAATTQHITILHGPRRGLTHDRINVEYLGQFSEPFTSKDIAGNRFHILLRGASSSVLEHADEIGRQGVPNYFDDQRFGSATAAGDFVARLMILGRYEEAIKLALTAPYEYDKVDQKREKSILLGKWGTWSECAAEMRDGSARRIAAYLAEQPDDFRGVVRLLHPELQGMYLAAYQSCIWNRMLAELLKRVVPVHGRMQLKLGPFPTARRLTDEQRAALLGTILPLPSARLPWQRDAPWAELIDAALHDQGFSLDKMKLPGLRKPFFSKGDRTAWVVPAQLSATAQSHGVALSFELPRGSYATIVVKQLQTFSK